MLIPSIDFTSYVEKFKKQIELIPYVHEQMMTNWERKVMVALACAFETSKGIFEFGTWRGLTTHVLAVTTGKQIYTVDCPHLRLGFDNYNAYQGFEALPVDEIGMECKTDTNVKKFLMDSILFNPEKEGLLGAMDLVLVDGNHTYKYIENDFNNGMKMLRGGGILVLHDFVPTLQVGLTLADNQSADVCNFVHHMAETLLWVHVKDTTLAFTIKIT
jgi:predicted O-methyltransferase YrrM